MTPAAAPSRWRSAVGAALLASTPAAGAEAPVLEVSAGYAAAVSRTVSRRTPAEAFDVGGAGPGLTSFQTVYRPFHLLGIRVGLARDAFTAQPAGQSPVRLGLWRGNAELLGTAALRPFELQASLGYGFAQIPWFERAGSLRGQALGRHAVIGGVTVGTRPEWGLLELGVQAPLVSALQPGGGLSTGFTASASIAAKVWRTAPWAVLLGVDARYFRDTVLNGEAYTSTALWLMGLSARVELAGAEAPLRK